MERKKKNQLESTSKIWKFIKEEHKFENWLLFILAIVLFVLSTYILLAGIDNAMEEADSTKDALSTFADEYFDISNSGWKIFNKPWKVIVISSCILVLSIASLVYCVWPVCVPSFKELKFVTWTDKKTLFTNSIIVIAFIGFLSALFFLLDLPLNALFEIVFEN